MIFNTILFIGNIILGLLSVSLALETKKRLSVDDEYRRYNESAVINLTTMSAVVLSSVCEAVLILFELNSLHCGILLIVTLRECLWLYPMSLLLFVPKVSTDYTTIHTTVAHNKFIIEPYTLIQHTPNL